MKNDPFFFHLVLHDAVQSHLMDDYYPEQDSQLTDVDDDDDNEEEAESSSATAGDSQHDTITSLRNFMERSKIFTSLQQHQQQQQFPDLLSGHFSTTPKSRYIPTSCGANNLFLSFFRHEL